MIKLGQDFNGIKSIKTFYMKLLKTTFNSQILKVFELWNY